VISYDAPKELLTSMPYRVLHASGIGTCWGQSDLFPFKVRNRGSRSQLWCGSHRKNGERP